MTPPSSDMSHMKRWGRGPGPIEAGALGHLMAICGDPRTVRTVKNGRRGGLGLGFWSSDASSATDAGREVREADGRLGGRIVTAWGMNRLNRFESVPNEIVCRATMTEVPAG